MTMAPDESDGERQTASPQQTSSDATVQSAAPGAADEFRSFLVSLATDPTKLGAFIKDPDGAMGAANIDPVDQVILKSGQPWTIHARLLGQKFSFTPPAPAPTVLVVDMTRQTGAGGSDETEQPTIRTGTIFTASANQGSSAMFPNFPIQVPQIFPQVHPQQVFPQIHPQQVFPQIHPQQVFPQIHPQQVFPQIHPQQVFPQIHPQQVFPQIHPQQVFPQIHPQQVFPQIHPQQVFPQIHPQQVFPQIHPQQVFPQIHPQQVFPQIFPTPGPQQG
jgi:hypothetical protein